MDWKGVLADLRAHLPAPARGRQRRGSLRWLEAEMRVRGANPAALRNIIYRDTGTRADKAALHGILTDLAREAGRPPPQEGGPERALPLPEELELLGRSKKRAYRQFLAGVRAGRAPRLIVAGRAGAGKTVLLDHLTRALEAQDVPVRLLRLGGEAADRLPLPVAAGSSFAAQAQTQTDAVRALLPPRGVLLARVTEDLTFRGGPPRDAHGTPLSAARWAATRLLGGLAPGVAGLLAVETRHGLDDLPFEVIELKAPTLAESRTYLMARLDIGQAEAEALVRETGRHLDRLTLLVNLRSGDPAAGDLLADPDTRRLVQAGAALDEINLHRPGAPWPDGLLRVALGAEPRTLPPHARALLRAGDPGGWSPSPVMRAAWSAVPAPARAEVLERLVAAGRDTPAAFRLAALAVLGRWDALAAAVAAQPDDGRYLPALWPLIRQAASGAERERLARSVVTHHAGRGEYGDPRLRDALFTLLESPRDAVRAWARVKLAESSLEGGAMDAARSQLDHPDVTDMRGGDPWTVAAQADALLVHAALARWQGDLETATRAASDPRTAEGGPRALLWRGLIAKDAGRWPEALQALQAVPASSPLLSARARYQEGDLLLRLGQPAPALEALLDAASRLEGAGAAPDELARVLARAATSLRRLGNVAGAHAQWTRALGLVPDDSRRREDLVPRARVVSEGLPILLALGQPDEALAQGVTALELLGRSEGRPAETAYRARRTRYRLALAYLCRGLGVAYLPPLGGAATDHPDLRQARVILDRLLAGAGVESQREHTLSFDMLLTRALADPDPDRALEHAERALALGRHVYDEAQAKAMRAEALLRRGEPGAALQDINRAHALLRRVAGGAGGAADGADPGLHAQLLALEARATLNHDGLGTLTWLRAALDEPRLAPFRSGVWREVGLALERSSLDTGAILQALVPGGGAPELRPGDLLRLAHAAAPAAREAGML